MKNIFIGLWISIVIIWLMMALNIYPQSNLSLQVFGNYHSGEKNNSFQFTRINTTYDYTADDVTYKFGVENDQTTKNQMYIKDANIGYNIYIANFIFGLQKNELFTPVEKVYDHRFVDKTIIDYRNIQQQRDLGLSIAGSIDILQYWVMYGNNYNGFTDNNNTKRFCFQFKLPMNNFIVSLFADKRYEMSPVVTYETFIGYTDKLVSAGMEGFQYSYSDINTYGVMAFMNCKFPYGFTVTGRVDFNKTINYGTMLYLFGIDYQLTKSLRIEPNIICDANRYTGRVSLEYYINIGN